MRYLIFIIVMLAASSLYLWWTDPARTDPPIVEAAKTTQPIYPKIVPPNQ